MFVNKIRLKKIGDMYDWGYNSTISKFLCCTLNEYMNKILNVHFETLVCNNIADNLFQNDLGHDWTLAQKSVIHTYQYGDQNISKRTNNTIEINTQ